MSGVPSQRPVACDECGKWKESEEITYTFESDDDNTNERVSATFQLCPTPGCPQWTEDRWEMRLWELQTDPALDDSPEVRKQEKQRIEEDREQLIEGFKYISDKYGTNEEESSDTSSSASEWGNLTSYLGMKEDQQFVDAERAATQVPQLVAILNGEDNERAAALRREADERDRDPAEYVPTTATQQLCNFARHHPDLVAAHAKTLVEHFDSDNEAVRRHIALTVMHAVTKPEPFVEYASTFITLLNDDDLAVRRTAAFTLGWIATVSPDDAVPAVGALVPLVDNSDTRFVATKALARIGDERPKAITSAASTVIHHFQALSAASSNPEPGDTVFRVAALEVIASIALVAPDTIDDMRDSLQRAAQSIQVDVRVQAADTIGVLITERSEMFASLEAHLQTGLDDEEQRVRRAAVLAYLWIGFNAPTSVDDPDAVAERLRMFDETFDIPDDDFEHAVQAFDTATEDGH